MMGLQMTGWRIKRLISYRKPPTLDTSDNSLEDLHFTDTKVSANPAKRLSWLSQSPTVEIAPLRTTTSSATVQTRMPTVSTTAHSSATSLCSCDCVANPVSSEPPLSKEWHDPNQPEILYHPPLSPHHASGDTQTWRLIFSESPSRSPASSISKSSQKERSTVTIAAGSTFDLIEALAFECAEDDKTPLQSIKHTNDSKMENLSDNVEQLIRETDAAFQAVGTALADAKAATQGWYDTDAPVPRNIPLPRGVLKKSPRSSVPSLKTQMSQSMSAVKESKPAKGNILGRALRGSPQLSTNTSSRWTLADVTTNMADFLSGKIFRTEVDEMLTPDRLQQLQESIRLSNERRESADSARSVETDSSTPTEPFHFESLSDRISAAQKNHPPFPSPSLPPSTTPQLKCQPPNETSRPKPPRKVQFVDSAIDGGNQSGMTIDEITFPSPPRIPRRPSASGNVPLLPTIPEISLLTLSPADVFTSTSTILSPPTLYSESEENYISLPSTPFTLTSPLFRHGTIRVPIPYREPKFSSRNEETLDWTAFQMAISGTGGVAGHGVADSFEREEREKMERKEDEREIDGILEWWARFGFQGWGRTVGDESLGKGLRRRGSLKRKKRREDIEKMVVEEPKASPQPCESVRKQVTDTEKIVVDYQRGVGLAFEAQRKPSLADSLPPSPMLDLVVPSPSKDNDVIPMGFNLGHDLGDFLRWETDHVQTLFMDY